jgi:hypothetical protein
LRLRADVALQDVGELFHEGLHGVGHAVDVVREAVVEDGETEPTEARKERLVSSASSSRWKLARMARRAPSSRAPLSVMRRSRSFWYSRMPLAKMRSMGPPRLAFWAAPA